MLTRDISKIKLGKKAPKRKPETLQLANYLALPSVPSSYAWLPKIKSYGMMLNDSIGDCTIAAAGHLIMEWTADNKKLFTPRNGDILKAYEAVSGYVPGDPSPDNGAVILDVLDYWRKTGIAGRKITAYAAAEPGNQQHIRASIYLFGGVDLGLQLPISAQGQKVWSVPPEGLTGDGAPGSWGGHSVPGLAFDANGVTVITWGETLRMTWQFFAAYCDEAYAIISPDFLAKSKSPAGVDLASLEADLKEIPG